MSFNIQANTTYKFTAIWLDDDRNLIEVVEPEIEIVHYGDGQKYYDVPKSAMVRREKGIYDYSLYLSLATFYFDVDYLVMYSARDASNVLGIIEDSFRIVIPSTNEGISTSTVR